MNNPYTKYKETQVGTASREKILLMLYEGAIRFSKLCKIAMENKDMNEKGKYIGKTLDIVFELKNTLDFKVAPEIANQLEGLYNYMIEELTNANIKNEVKLVDNVINVLTTLYTGWKEAVDKFQKEKTMEGKKNEGSN